MKLPIKIIFSAALVAVVLASTVPAAAADHYLIADQFNNRVIEVDHRGNIVWHFGLGPADFSPASIIGVNDAQRVGEFTLMAGTGTPGGQPEAPNCTKPSGCPDDRVILVGRGGNIVWQYGQFGVAGCGSTTRIAQSFWRTATFSSATKITIAPSRSRARSRSAAILSGNMAAATRTTVIR